MGRRPGTEKTITREVPAPADLGIDVLKVVEGSPLALEVRLECIMEGVLATGLISATAEGECVRCLTEIEFPLDLRVQELFVYGEPDEDELGLEDDILDLEPVLRDAVVLRLPQNPLCNQDCPGLCPECGARLADDPDHTHGPAIDPRWSALTELTERPEE
ncbi:MAG: DUF177 domain-containing protein [Actinomycetales bacterium]|nr:DUF177 domain-containing protein [Actinomycetales bacterium]